MRVEIESREVAVTSQQRQRFERQLTYSLSRFDRLIQRVMVSIERLRGPTGGLDHRCRIQAKLTGRLTIVADVRDVSLEHVLHRASARVARRLREKLNSQAEKYKAHPVPPGSPEVIWISEF